jgi:hypothetical protein
MRNTGIAILAGLLATACVNDPNAYPGGGSGSGNGNGSGGSGSGGGDAVGGNGEIMGCGKATFPINTTKTEPNVMLVVDESGSMKDLVPGTNLSKWDSLKGAVQALLAQYNGMVNWGLSVFPKPGADQCAAGAVDVPLGPGTITKILQTLQPLNNMTIGGSTPTDSTLQAVMAGAGLNDPTRNNYVLLMTDGLPNCGGDGNSVQKTIGMLYAQTPSVSTYVVGIGDGTQSSPTTLDGWATAGHSARKGTPLYYQANNTNELTMAFADIVAGIASCTYKLGMKPDDPNLITSYIDGKLVPIDGTNGVTYDPGSQSIIFHGMSCDAIKAGAKSVDVIYGCPSPTIG